MFYFGDTNKHLLENIERLLMDSKVRLAMTSDVGTSTEVCREKIRMAAKNVAEIEKIFICLITERGPLESNLGWRFISTQRMFADIKKEVKIWSSKLFGTEHLNLSSFGQIYDHIEEQYALSYSGQCSQIKFFNYQKKLDFFLFWNSYKGAGPKGPK